MGTYLEKQPLGGSSLILLFSSVSWVEGTLSIETFNKYGLNYTLAHTVTTILQNTRAPEAMCIVSPWLQMDGQWHPYESWGIALFIPPFFWILYVTQAPQFRGVSLNADAQLYSRTSWREGAKGEMFFWYRVVFNMKLMLVFLLLYNFAFKELHYCTALLWRNSTLAY